MHNVYSFFPCLVYRSDLPGWVNQIKKVTQKYFQESYKEQSGNNVIQTRNMIHDNELVFFKEHALKESVFFLEKQGYITSENNFFVCDLWGQEFKHNGINFPHVHPNCQISGLYFYNIAFEDEIFIDVKIYDPRPGKTMIDLPLVASQNVLPATPVISLNAPTEGTLILFNSWLTHSLTVQGQGSTVKFLHFNIGYELKK